MNRVADPDWHSRGEPLHHGGRGYYDDPQWDEPEEYPGYGEGQRMRSPPNGYSSDQASSLMNDGGPSYLLEHLATFRVAEESDLMYPADGMRRLLHMEKTTGIWTQRMQLKLERDWVMILSHENKDTVEKFPIQLIQEPTAYTSNDPRELYNNIFIFVVAEDPKGDYTNCTEMHIFQCLEISAKDIVEDMKMCMAGRWGNIPRHPETSGGMRRAPPPDKRNQPPSNGYNRAAPYLEAPMRGRRSPRSSVEGGPGGIDRGGDDASSVSSESYSRDVAILNCCFDDIERFIARLQHTAAATRELKKRQQSRKIKKNNIGDGLLSMRAKRPSTSEFEEILQKFKLSFNMLGKLRTYIHEPNAPELVHFLFTPLALIVDASRDDQPPPDTPAKVLSPLLTREAIDLLTNCLSSRETELWQSLGDPWTIPKEVWKYPVPPYQPVFSSGWAPELPEEGRDSRPESHKHHRQDMDDLYGGKRSSQSPSRYQRNPYPESDGSVSESGPEGPPGGPGTSMQWLNELRGRGARVVQVIYPRTANNEKELTVIRGEYLEVVDDSRKWWKCGNSRGLVAHVPHTIVTPYAADGPQEGMRSTGADWVRQERQGKKGEFSYISPIGNNLGIMGHDSP